MFMLENDTGKMTFELLRIASIVTHELAVDRTELVIDCINRIHPTLFKMYTPRQAKQDTKVCIFEILNLSILLQSAQKETRDAAKWHLLLRGSIDLIDREIEMYDTQTGHSQTTKMNPVFIEFSARAASHAFWDANIWNTNLEPDAPESKRNKISVKFESFHDRITLQSHKFSHRWLLILCRTLKLNPLLLQVCDHGQLLQLLSNVLSTVVQIDELDTCFMLSEILINFEKANQINLTPAEQELWHGITLTTYRWCAGNSKLNNDSHKLLALLIENKKFSMTFMESFIDGYLKGSIKRNNMGVKTLIVALLRYNMNRLPDAKEVIEKIISSVLCRNVQSSLLSGEARPDEKFIALLVGICTIWTNLYNDRLCETLIKFLHTQTLENVKTQYEADIEFIE